MMNPSPTSDIFDEVEAELPKPSATYIVGDIHLKILSIPDNSIDFIYTSPPFGITEAKWDNPLDWANLFPEMWRVLKPNGVIALYSSQRFTYSLLKHETPRYHYTWIKSNSTGFFQAKRQPLRNTEEILIYYKKQPTYNPQMEGTKFYPKQIRKLCDKQQHFGRRNNVEKTTISKTEGHVGTYPTTERRWKVRKDGSGITRDDENIDFFIKTYTNEGDTILDLTCCNKTVGNRALENSRNYIGVDIRPIPE